MKRLLFTFMLFLFHQYMAYAIYPIIRNFTRNQYKSGTQNWDITQNSGGCIYFANNNGMLEFDGKEWTTYPIPNYTNTRSVLFDSDNDRLYVGAFNEFGYYKLNKHGKMVYHSLIHKFPSPTEVAEIWKIHKAEQSLYLQSNKEIYKYNNDIIQEFHFKHKIDCSAIIRNSLFISNKEEGPMILSGNTFLRLPNAEIITGKKVCAILPYLSDKLLFVTDLHGVYIYDNIKMLPFTMDIDPQLKKDQVFCAATDSTSIAFGTVSNGLIVKNLQDNTTLHSNTFSGLQNNTVLSIFFDKEKNLWLGLDKGIDYVTINTPEFSLFGSKNLYGSGYTSQIWRNKLYLGTNQGLYYMDYPIINQLETNQIKSVKDLQGQVWCLKEIDNNLLCGHDRGAFIIEGDKAEKIPHISGVWNFIKLKNHQNLILGCSYDGLFVLKKENGKWEFSHYIKGFRESSGMFLEEADGKIWMNHWVKGLFRLTLNEKTDSIISTEFFGKKEGFPTSRNNLLNTFRERIIFSSEGGFYKFDQTRDKIVPVEELNTLFNDPPVALRLWESPQEDLYFTSGNFQGIAFKNHDNTYSLDSVSLNFLQDKRISGFENLNFIDQNSLLFSTEDGFSWINIDKIKKQHNSNRNKVFIKNLYITNNNKDSLIYGGRNTPEKQVIHVLPYINNSLRFEFIVPEFKKEDGILYSYFLENYDKEWSTYSLSNKKEYTKLDQGIYLFHVKAKSKFNSEISETVYQFKILPPWYLSTAAYWTYVILFLLSIWGLTYFINIRSRQEAFEVEKRKEEEMKKQQLKFEKDAREREKEIVLLKNQTLEYNLRHKSQDLASSTLNLIRKNEILLKIKDDLIKMHSYLIDKEDSNKMVKLLTKVQKDIRENIEHDNDWQKFEQNFDIVYEDYLKRLGEQFPQLSVSDKKLCAYLKMDLSSKDIAPLLNMSVRSVEMARYRLRKKMELNRDINLTDFLQHF